jgi:hypothetical protein
VQGCRSWASLLLIHWIAGGGQQQPTPLVHPRASVSIVELLLLLLLLPRS